MNFRYICLSLLFFMLIVPEKWLLAQEVESAYEVMRVKGRPLKSGKNKFQKGEKVNMEEKLMFTTLSDMVEMISETSDKIQLNPKGAEELKRMVKIRDYVNQREQSQVKLRNEIIRMRGAGEHLEFQSLKDTLKLNLLLDLKIKSEQKSGTFQVMDLFNESLPNSVQVNDEEVLIYPSKKGMLQLFFQRKGQPSRLVATMEFFNPSEIEEEILFVKNKFQDKANQAEILQNYIRKHYGKTPSYQADELLKR